MSDFGFRVDCDRRKFWLLAHRPGWGSQMCAGLIVAITLACTVGCDKFTTVHGVVVDDDQTPIEGAVARLVRLDTGKAAEDVSNPHGSFVASISHGSFAGRFTITV